MSIHPVEHVRALANEIGSRMVGTPGNKAAADYIRSAFQHAGLEVESLPFPFPNWSVGLVQLIVAGELIETYANTFSPPADVTGPLLPISSLAELDAADLDGAVVLLSGALVPGPLSARGFFFASEQDLKVIGQLEMGGAAAVLTVNPVPGMRFRMIEDPDFGLPSVTVPLPVGLDLSRRTGAQTRLVIESLREASTCEHIIARIPGTRPERIVLCAHFDSKIDTCGAIDNASGVAALLALAERLAQSPHRPTIELIAFNQEEHYSSPDEDVYAQNYLSTFGDIIAAINMDGIGCALTPTGLATFVTSPAFEQVVDDSRAGFPGVVRVEAWPASNHYLYFANGVPTIALSMAGSFGLHHTPLDTIEWIDPQRLEDVVELVCRLVERREDHDPNWGRPVEG